jgi:hypothetical protein
MVVSIARREFNGDRMRGTESCRGFDEIDPERRLCLESESFFFFVESKNAVLNEIYSGIAKEEIIKKRFQKYNMRRTFNICGVHGRIFNDSFHPLKHGSIKIF